ncbi:cytochrome c1 [Iodobacter fluviatilis]|uniref:Cytochrome c1 n=1 Tax=Iodobacter fluviatilis TaxID=537 RepID=A0A377SXE0_9NEIS|nr:cytochrome c1 [Iodobacter fluviatilis]TCU85566.1 ubiquinol-cytochrome c reductase cytochrome c1 subunit [Iodobacter fluviatilis]STR44986.1 Cytochrome c1 precursor [Iodobacter fluviatilis]
MKKTLNTLLFALLASVSFGSQANTEVHLDKAPINLRDTESLQRGAQTFANYCLSCHGAVAMRYNRLQDIGLTEDQIKANLMFPTEKVGDLMKVSMQAKDAKVWFGATPPDLSVISRSRGADYLYTYLRSFYRDETRPTGWNNLTFDKVGMPNVLWDLQGQQELEVKKEGEHEHKALKLVKPGSLTKTAENGAFDQAEFDHRVADLVNYMVYMGEPAQVKREQIGYGVLLFLLFFLIPISYMLKKEYWRDVH